MARCYLDTNIIIRYLTQDNAQLSAKARRILTPIKEGSLSATTCESIISECVYVLASQHLYRLPRPRIKALLSVILSFKGLKLPHKRTYRRALELYAASTLDFPDALAVAHMERQKITDIYSFDKDFDGIAGIHRREQ